MIAKEGKDNWNQFKWKTKSEFKLCNSPQKARKCVHVHYSPSKILPAFHPEVFKYYHIPKIFIKTVVCISEHALVVIWTYGEKLAPIKARGERGIWQDCQERQDIFPLSTLLDKQHKHVLSHRLGASRIS